MPLRILKKDKSRNPNPKTPTMMGEEKSNKKDKMIAVLDKDNKQVYVKKSELAKNSKDYKPVPSGRLSTADIELSKKLMQRSKGGAMLKNPGKADLDKDGKLSGYEKKRGMAIEKNMKPMKAVVGALALGAAGALGAKKFLKRKKTATSNTGKMPVGDLVENKKKELMGKRFGGVMKRSKGGGADAGKMKSSSQKEFEAYNKMRDTFEKQKKMQQRRREMQKDKEKIAERKKGIAVKSGGMMKFNKGGGADTGKIGELKSKLAVAGDKFRKFKRDMKKNPRPRLQAPERKPMKPLKAMGGGMMMKPMGYKKGTMVMARGCKLGRKKATKIM